MKLSNNITELRNANKQHLNNNAWEFLQLSTNGTPTTERQQYLSRNYTIKLSNIRRSCSQTVYK